MAFKLNGTGANVTKMYLFPKSHGGVECRDWAYVTADTVATVVTSGYIDFSANPTDQDHEIAKDMLKVGDVIHIYTVAAITDTRTIADDIAAGLADYGRAIVLVNSGGVVNLSNDLEAATVTYTVS